MKQEIIKQLEKMLGKENVKSDKAHLVAYCYDATKERYEPDAVVFPRDEKDVSNILKFCNQNNVIITPRGYGSGFTGGSLPAKHGIVMSLEKHMNKILEIDTANMIAIVQPGVVNKDLQNHVESMGLFYPPDPASQEFSTIGGNVAENAGGMRAAKYGITKDYVMALRAVMPNGDIIKAGKKTIKDVAGYNIVGTLIGSEGTLGVITQVTLKLITKPKMQQSAMAIFDTIEDAMNAVYKTMAAGASPVAMEFLDALSIQAVEKTFKKGLPLDAGAILVTQVDGNSQSVLDEQLQVIKETFDKNKCKEFKIATSKEEEEDLWFARRNASPATAIYGTKKINEDITVPRSNLPALLEEIDKVSKKYSVKIPCFGHTGDGNVHVNVMVKDKNDKEQVAIGYKAIEEIFQIAIDLEGTLSGEHGIGLSKAPYMNMAFTQEELNVFKTLKKAFDPNNILNPSKMGLA